MTNLQELFKLVQKQNQSMHKITALSPWTNLVDSIYQKKIENNNFTFTSLTSSMPKITNHNQLIFDKLNSFAISQLLVSNSLTVMMKSINQSHLNQFNTLNIALQGISKGFLREIYVAKTWDDFNFAEEANEVIFNITEETICNKTVITQGDLDNFKTSIVSELSTLLSKSISEKARQLIIELITVISFILTLYSIHQTSSDKSNKELLIETKKELDKYNIEFSHMITTKLEKLNKMRISSTNVNLRCYAKKNSRIIGLVKKNQPVTVIEIRHKFLLISYIDIETGEPKSGFVLKKYFKAVK